MFQSPYGDLSVGNCPAFHAYQFTDWVSVPLRGFIGRKLSYLFPCSLDPVVSVPLRGFIGRKLTFVTLTMYIIASFSPLTGIYR